MEEYECLGGGALQNGREGVPGTQGGHRQAGGLHQRLLLHPLLVAHQVRRRRFLICKSSLISYLKGIEN